MPISKSKNIEIIPPKSVWKGNPEARISLVEFGDYESDACAKVLPVVQKVLEHYNGKVKFNFRHFPLTQLHQHAQKAAEAAVGAAQEGKFWEMHELLFERRRNLGTISLKNYAREAGVENKRFLTEMIDSTYSWTVRNDLLEGVDKGVRDVPTFFINDEQFQGKPTFDNLVKAIDTALKSAKRKSPARQRA